LYKDPRVVFAYHGTRLDRADTIVGTGKFIPSTNDYDWLGHGIYFWEHAPLRAWQWAKEKYGSEGRVIEAKIQLGFCLDLTDIRFTDALKAAHEGISEAYILASKSLPMNKGKARFLDCLVINYLTRYILSECDTVRAPFLEGDPIFKGSNLLTQSHLQLVVKNDACIQPGLNFLHEGDK
jgi:hypothetical protein